MSEMAPDEKACPFCAETIKVAAIKCRFCHSDLPVGDDPLATDPGPDASEGAPEPEPEPEAAPEAALEAGEPSAAGPAPTAARRIPWLTAALGVLCVALAVVLVLLVRDRTSDDLGVADHGQVTDAAFRDGALSAASANTTALLSYDYKSLDADRRTALAVLTSDFGKDYAEEMAQVGPVAVQQKRARAATVRSAAIVSLKEDTAVVLVFANVATTQNGVQTSLPEYKRVLLTMKRDAGDWVISKTEDLLIN